MKGKAVPRTRVPEQVELQEGLDQLDIGERLQTEIDTMGMRLPDRPVYIDEESQAEVEYFGQLPDNVTELQDVELYQEMEKQTKWLNYVNGQLAQADIRLSTAKRKAELAKAKIRLSYRVDDRGDARAKDDARDMQECDRVYVNIQSELLFCEALVAYITAIKKTGEDSYAVLSRRVTQRGQELERDRRTTGVANGNWRRPGAQPETAGPRFGGGGRR
jgi:hypothetical protein